MNNVLEIVNLSKDYGSVQALENLTLNLETAKIYGLLGRNGAGKTTLLNLITSRIYTAKGEIRLFGKPGIDNQDALSRICYMPEKNLFPAGMRVNEILAAAASFYPNYDQAYAGSLCQQFRLDPRKKYKALSRGYESVLRIVIGLAARADITIFDEPILGLDAAGRDQFYQALIKDYSDSPRTFILSTHLIDESADIFEEVIILKEGRLLLFEPAEKMRQEACQLSGRIDVLEKFAREQQLTIIGREGIGHLASFAIRGSLIASQRELAAATGLELSPISLQKLFIYLTESESAERVG
jgi:ABC-2 type transport system ATP-binding protein